MLCCICICICGRCRTFVCVCVSRCVWACAWGTRRSARARRDQLDAIASVYATWPTTIGVMCVTVLLFTGAAFRSLLIPLRAVFTIGLTILFVYGAVVYVYQVCETRMI